MECTKVLQYWNFNSEQNEKAARQHYADKGGFHSTVIYKGAEPIPCLQNIIKLRIFDTPFPL